MYNRNHNQSKDHFDLLPFIAILMCILGTLLLVTISIAALSLGPNHGEGWMPRRDSSTTSKTPILNEWDGAIATIHNEGRKLVASWARATSRRVVNDYWVNQENDPILDDFLTRLSQDQATHYALFAVRPSGFDSFVHFADEFRSRNIDVGYEPIAQERPVRLLKERVQP